MKKSGSSFLAGSAFPAVCFLRFNHFAAANAGRAHTHPFRGGAHASVHWAQIHIPSPLGDVMGVADSVS
jgi:hypothetical protein